MVCLMFLETAIFDSGDLKNIIIGLISGIISGVIVTATFNLTAKIKNEKKELQEAINHYIGYCQELIAVLKKFQKGENELEEIEKAIQDYPYCVGFNYTNSKVIKEIKEIIENIKADVIGKRFNASKAHKYTGELQNKVFKLLKVEFKFKND